MNKRIDHILDTRTLALSCPSNIVFIKTSQIKILCAVGMCHKSATIRWNLELSKDYVLVCSDCHNDAFRWLKYFKPNYSDERNKTVSPQKQPTEGKTKILDLVVSDLKQRAKDGKEKYGTYLESHNGRDALIDAYQEALDLCMYLRQEIEERNDG